MHRTDDLASGAAVVPSFDTAQPQAKPVRALHVLDLSLPLLVGYSIRSRGLMRAQSRIGMRPTALSGPIHTLREPGCTNDVFDGINYKRTALVGLTGKIAQKRWPVARELALMKVLEKQIDRELDSGSYDVVHAHSPILCGIPAMRSARRHKLPFVYEIRAFWEDAAVESHKTGETSARYRATRAMETHLVRKADAVVAITQSLLDDLAGRGIDRSKLFLVPNGVDLDQFQPTSRDHALAEQLGLGNEPVLGFIGSFYKFEGVIWLLQAADSLRRSGTNFKLLLVGAGEDANMVTETIERLKMQDFVKYVGKVPHEEIDRYYSLIDVMVYPRLRTRLTTLVTPLKPLEAMAKNIAVLGSDVGGVAEILQHGKAGRLFRAYDNESFCEQAKALLEDKAQRQSISQAGFEYVHQRRNWDVLARTYEDVYEYAESARKSKN